MKVRFKSGKTAEVKTVDQLIALLPEKKLFCLSSKSAFYFIGTKEQYEADIGLIERHYLRKHATDVKVAKKSKKLMQQLPTFEPMRTRRVLEMFPRHVSGEPPMLIIRVEGWESGCLWLQSEYDEMISRFRMEEQEEKEKLSKTAKQIA